MSKDSTNMGLAEPGVHEADGKEEGASSVRASESRARRNGHERLRAEKTESKPKGPRKTIFREYFESAVVTVIMALFGMTFIVQAVKVPTGSMQNTIIVGDHLLVNKFIFAPGPPLPFLPQREIRRGDIIVFKYPGNPHKNWQEQLNDPENTPFKTNYVKRVIGLPGDTIELVGTEVLVNGKVLPEHVVTGENNNEKAPLEILENPAARNEPYTVFYYPETVEAAREGHPLRAGSDFRYAVNGVPYKVPADHYFVMGDNRDNSSDSRVWGVVHRNYVIGRAMFVYWSYDESAPQDGNPLALFLRNTRWNRTGTMVK